MMAFGPVIAGLSRRSGRSIAKSHTAAAASASTNAVAVILFSPAATTSSTGRRRCFSNNNNNKKTHNDKKIADLDSLHIPVMQDEVLKLWLPENKTDDIVHLIDGTLGMGGHTLAAVKRAESVRVLGIDRDDSALAKAKKRTKIHLDDFFDETAANANDSENEEEAAPAATDESSSRIAFYHGSFSDVSPNLLMKHSFPPKVNGILIDLGMNSHQIDNPSRGFTFRKHGPLDMRFDTTSSASDVTSSDKAKRGDKAKDIINTWTASELSVMFKKYADEPYAYSIASGIIEWRKSQQAQSGGGGGRKKQSSAEIRSTLELRYIIEEAVESATAKEKGGGDDDITQMRRMLKRNDKRSGTKNKFDEFALIWRSPPPSKNSYSKQKVPSKKKKEKLLRQYEERKLRHPNHVMRCFQALRIAVNNELDHIRSFFRRENASQCLRMGGRLVVIAFHPGEDEVVRDEMNKLVATGDFKLITPEADGLRPSLEEAKVNGRSRTARVRAVERIN